MRLPFACLPSMLASKQAFLHARRCSGYADRRAAKMDQDDFLRLLAAFNVAGIHFS